jgi:5-(carboxyamino)imidazole ribonucleotide synthase
MSGQQTDFTFPSLGILGGGQLGKMLCQQASKWSLPISVLDISARFPAGSVCTHFVEGDFTSYDEALSFGRMHEVITIEIESVNSEALHALADSGVQVHPNPVSLDIIKDKYAQKQFYVTNGLPTSDFRAFDKLQEISAAVKSGELALPFVLKARRDGYDGRGVMIIRSHDELEQAFDLPCIAEPLVDIEMEIAVIAARNANGEIKTFPVVGMEFHPEANLVEYLHCPAGIGPALEQEAIHIAQAVIEAFDMCGLLAVEMFLTKDGDLIINEVAPRPHNSGHHTIEACNASQYEQHLRGILNLPLVDIQLKSPAVMINLLGEPGFSGPAKYRGMQECLKVHGAYIHLYGKAITKPWRKMGHVTVIAENIERAREKAKFVKDTLKVVA